MSNHEEHSFPPNGAVDPDAKLIVDLGCNLGEVTTRLAYAFPEANILAVEMNPDTAGHARINLTPFYPRVGVVNYAVGYPHGRSGAELLGAQMDHRVEGDDLEVFTLDEILIREGLGGCTIDFLKMDIEGSEYEVLIGGGHWAALTNTMLVERHREDPIEALIQALGFKTRPRLDDPTWGNHHWCWR